MPFPKSLRSLLIACAALVGSVPALVNAQEATGNREDNGVLRVFLDCDSGCDGEFIRQEIDFINWVRDRQDSQVHVLITRQNTGGGVQYELEFIGRETFVEQRQQLIYSSSQTDTDDERRRGLARTLRLGLAAYIVQTPMGAYADVVVSTPDDGPGRAMLAATAESDPWNFWVFSLRGEGDLRGEDRTSSNSVEGRVSASRTTDAWKIRLSSEVEYRERDFEFDDGLSFKDVSRSFDGGGQVVKSLGANWGAGLGISVRQTTFFNLSTSYRAAAAVEYNIFPYSVSSQKQLTFTYFMGANRFNYTDETIFEKTQETLVDQGIIASLELERPWGSASIDLTVNHFLQEPGQLNLELDGEMSYRIVRGLSFNVSGGVESIRSQRYLPASGASAEEILLERRALATDFRYSVGVGLSYTFGSIFNNVVNSRISGDAGGFHTIF